MPWMCARCGKVESVRREYTGYQACTDFFDPDDQELMDVVDTDHGDMYDSGEYEEPCCGECARSIEWIEEEDMDAFQAEHMITLERIRVGRRWITGS